MNAGELIRLEKETIIGSCSSCGADRERAGCWPNRPREINDTPRSQDRATDTSSDGLPKPSKIQWIKHKSP